VVSFVKISLNFNRGKFTVRARALPDTVVRALGARITDTTNAWRVMAATEAGRNLRDPRREMADIGEGRAKASFRTDIGWSELLTACHSCNAVSEANGKLEMLSHHLGEGIR
jgi:hypothetical protein